MFNQFLKIFSEYLIIETNYFSIYTENIPGIWERVVIFI